MFRIPKADYQNPMVDGGIEPENHSSKAEEDIPEDLDIEKDIIQTQTHFGRQGDGIENHLGFQKLDQKLGLFIKQKLQVDKILSGCETENNYQIFALDAGGENNNNLLFKCTERSNLCARMTLPRVCRPFEMNISTTKENGESEVFLCIDTPCKCSCLWFNRPELNVTLIGVEKNEYIGKIVDAFKMGNICLRIYDKHNIHKYTIVGSCCQLGIWFRCPCRPCQAADFEIITASGKMISHLKRRDQGYMKDEVTYLYGFVLTFPQDFLPLEKALLMSAVLYLDHRHFEANPNESDRDLNRT